MIEAFPLHWPEGWKRTEHLRNSAFKTGFGKARNFLIWEIQRMGGTDIILSTNVPLNKGDGLPRSNYTPNDPAVAVYFKLKSRDMVFACDRYYTVTENFQAIGKTIEALRGIERWGASDMMERAFRGFAALPEKASSPWREILELPSNDVTKQEVDSAFRRLAHQYHPDKEGGDPEKFNQIVRAREAAYLEVQ